MRELRGADGLEYSQRDGYEKSLRETESDPLTPRDHRLPLDQQQALRKLFEASRTEADPQPIRVKVLIVNDRIRMFENFRVTDIRRQRYGGYELIAEYTGPNPNARFPELRPGIKFVFPIEQVATLHNAP